MKALIEKIHSLFSENREATQNAFAEFGDAAGQESPLSGIRHNIAVSERALYRAEKNYRRVAMNYSVGEADKNELVIAGEMLTKSRSFFVNTLYELQAILDRNLQRRAA